MPPQRRSLDHRLLANTIQEKLGKYILPSCHVEEGQSLLKAQFDQNYFDLDSQSPFMLKLKRTHSGVCQDIQMCQFPTFPHPTTNETASTIISVVCKDQKSLPEDLEMKIEVVDVAGTNVPNGVKISKNGCADSIKISVDSRGTCSAKVGMAVTSSFHYDCKTKEFSNFRHRGYLYFRVTLLIKSTQSETTVWSPPMWSISRMPPGRSSCSSSFVMIPKKEGVIVCEAQSLTKHVYKGREVQGQRQYRRSIQTTGLATWIPYSNNIASHFYPNKVSNVDGPRLDRGSVQQNELTEKDSELDSNDGNFFSETSLSIDEKYADTVIQKPLKKDEFLSYSPTFHPVEPWCDMKEFATIRASIHESWEEVSEYELETIL